MTREAAFFDLDRTLLSGASAHVVTKVLRETGVVTRDIPGESFLYRVFEVFGENLPSMVLGRQAVVAMKGHRRDAVRSRVARCDHSLLRPSASHPAPNSPDPCRRCRPSRFRHSRDSRVR